MQRYHNLCTSIPLQSTSALLHHVASFLHGATLVHAASFLQVTLYHKALTLRVLSH
ncbi:hypothetical protein HMPREF3190_01706 [Umbribacter vaginalis]|nr:hypothetical protein HMPREF3190_01706 [Coriobacteriales bacterium DNF00809]